MKEKSRIFIPVTLLLILFACQNEPVDYLYEMPEEKESRMEWWEEARFGMFIHWGLYAVPAGEWYGSTNHAEWIRTTAQIPLEAYDRLVSEFNPVNFNADQWVQTAKKAGMKYIVITSKHHDGFCLFDSGETAFDVMSTPYRKDILKQLATACRKEGIKICWYHSIMDWHHPDYLPRRGWETTRSEEGADFDNYVAYMKRQIRELLSKYGDIGVLWFDGEWESTWTHEKGKDLYNYVRNLQPDIIVNNRVDVGRAGMSGLTRPGEFAGDFGTPEQEIPSTGLPGTYWETCMTMNDHWGYNKHDNNWKSPEELIRKLADITSKGGNFLLNVGPRADGTFPEESISILTAMGNWMETNSEAIYGTSSSPFKKLNFGRCTLIPGRESSRLFLHVFDWPANGILKVPGVYNTPTNAFLLSDPDRKKLVVYRHEDALNIRLPDSAPDPVNTVVVLDVDGMPDVTNAPVIHGENDIFVDLISIDITAENEKAIVHYTLDGSIPDTTSPAVEGAITLDHSAVIIARCFRDGIAASDTAMARVRKVEPFPALQPENISSGLLCDYYEGDWDSIPEFNGITAIKQLTVQEITLAPREQDNYYAFRFDGFIELPDDGVYRFYTESDDGSRLYIDDRLVVDNDGLHGVEEASGAVPLSKGLHRIMVTFFEKTGSDALNVSFQPPDGARMPLPAKILYHTKKKGD